VHTALLYNSLRNQIIVQGNYTADNLDHILGVIMECAQKQADTIGHHAKAILNNPAGAQDSVPLG
jgi:hypothetical protein